MKVSCMMVNVFSCGSQVNPVGPVREAALGVVQDASLIRPQCLALAVPHDLGLVSPRSSPNKSLKPPKKNKKNPKSHGKNVINTTSPKSSSSEGLSFGLPQVPSHQNPV